jgi:GAF domain-containing protein
MSGTSFDPRVVEILKRRYVDLERMVEGGQESSAAPGLTAILVERDLAPAAGFDDPEAVSVSGGDADFLSSIAAARQEAQTMFELSQDLGNSLSLGETLSVLSMRLRRLIPYDSMAVFLCKNGRLIPELVSGDNFRLLSSLNIRLGEGLCGWVAENRKPIMNGNPQLESGYVNDPEKYTTLRSALAVPLEGLNGVVGVLVMYRADRDAFTPPSAHSAGDQFEDRALRRKRVEVPAGGKLRDDRLPDRVAKCPVTVRPSSANWLVAAAPARRWR